VFRSDLRALLLSALPATAAVASVTLASSGALAAVPLGSDAFIPFNPPVGAALVGDSIVGPGAVETFDPVARAQLLANEIPRRWTGTYQSFDTGEVVPVQLQLASLRPLGQMVDLRGEMTIGSVTTPVQGNLNAESDQLDLLVLCDCKGVGGLELGGLFSGLQGLQLSGWQAPRLTNQGGRLELRAGAEGAEVQRGVQFRSPSAAPAAGTPVRGLW
jgi:hypothetical protein